MQSRHELLFFVVTVGDGADVDCCRDAPADAAAVAVAATVAVAAVAAAAIRSITSVILFRRFRVPTRANHCGMQRNLPNCLSFF